MELVLRDSFCSETYGPLQGIDLYVEKAAHVFVGPACDYAVAPLARFSFRWKIPILTGRRPGQRFSRQERIQAADPRAGTLRQGWRVRIECLRAFPLEGGRTCVS
ncbi:hypothetical protein BaRGS_00034590 [Batillaria attramentaria]|uniref:Receptor ligand binding region domain-containing protein n=1 Tax=Batillaria attramentaria TaxID=370345 RepID=A0ABD0JIF3_9CAEN